MPATSQHQTTTRNAGAKSTLTQKTQRVARTKAKSAAPAKMPVNVVKPKTARASKKIATTKRAPTVKGTTTKKERNTSAKKTQSGAASDKAKSNTQVQADIGSIVGQIAWLMMHSAPHKHLFITDMEWLVLPPIMLGQVRLFHREERPFAVASWAYLNEDVEKRLMSGQQRLSPAEWKSGDRPWLIDFIAPFGGGDEILKVLSKQVFAGKPFKAIRPAPDGKGMQVVNVGTQDVVHKKSSSVNG